VRGVGRPGEENPLLEHLELLRRRWRLVAATFLGFVVVAAAATTRMDPVYQATSRIVVGAGAPRSPIGDRTSSLESYLLEVRSFETQLEVVASEPVAMRAAEILGRIDPESSPARRRAAADAIQGAIDVDRVRDTRIVRVRARDPWPEGARDVANALAEAYIEYAGQQRDAARQRSIAWLTAETANMREELRASEERLVDYVSQAGIDAGVVAEPGAAPDAAEERLKGQIAAAELELAGLRRRYLERHPRVVETKSRLAALRQKLASSRSRQAQDDRKLIHYRILKRDAELDHELYQVLLKKLKEADISADLSEPDVRILEPARLPERPLAPRTARTLGVAAVLGLCVALILAYAVALFDRRVRTPSDVQRAFGLPTLGVVQAFRKGEGLAAADARSAEGEAFRALRTNVRFSHVDRPRRTVLVTSTGPEEGKSTVLSNLAVSLAQSGRRTLVVDTDLRRPALHELFDRPNARGLVDLLAGDATLEETLQATDWEGLDLLACGTLPPNPAELIESTRLQERISELRSRYDYVLLDSPPAGALVDASLLAGLSDGVLFVVEPGRFDARDVRGAFVQLERAGARLYGVVLNKAPRDERANLYGYAYASDAVRGDGGGPLSATGPA